MAKKHKSGLKGRDKRQRGGLRSQTTAWAQMPTLLLIKCVTLGKSLNLSAPQFLHKARIIVPLYRVVRMPEWVKKKKKGKALGTVHTVHTEQTYSACHAGVKEWHFHCLYRGRTKRQKTKLVTSPISCQPDSLVNHLMTSARKKGPGETLLFPPQSSPLDHAP